MNKFLNRLLGRNAAHSASGSFGSQEQDIERALGQAHEWLDSEAQGNSPRPGRSGWHRPERSHSGAETLLRNAA